MKIRKKEMFLIKSRRTMRVFWYVFLVDRSANRKFPSAREFLASRVQGASEGHLMHIYAGT